MVQSPEALVAPVRDETHTFPSWKRYLNRLFANEISTVARYCSSLVQWLPLPNDSGLLLQEIQCGKKSVARVDSEIEAQAILINGTFNHHQDVQDLLQRLKAKLNRSSRVFIVAYNPYLSWLYRLANSLGLRKGEQPTTFLTETDYHNICALSGFQLVHSRRVGYFPWKLLGIGNLINSLCPLVPGIRLFSFASILVLRPIVSTATKRPSLSIVIPARNERGNIQNALDRMPDLGAKLEILFVEGHSSDNTWEEILRVQKAYSDRFDIKALRQVGKGKNDAVRLGFSQATGELLTILDADLTMPPELLGRFYEAYCSGLADFVNGSRLTYPMEGEAMRFLNHLGNVFFAKALSFVLGIRIGDSLCGTKLVSKEDYRRIVAWRGDFGDFDPFGDFELLFPAATLGLGVIDVPVRYRARTYGSTNIHRFRHGLILLRMTWIGLCRIKIGKTA